MSKPIRDRADLSEQLAALKAAHPVEAADFERGILDTLEWLTIRKGPAPISGLRNLYRPVFLDVEREEEYARECRDGKERGYLGDVLPPLPAEYCDGVERACQWALDPEDATALA